MRYKRIGKNAITVKKDRIVGVGFRMKFLISPTIPKGSFIPVLLNPVIAVNRYPATVKMAATFIALIILFLSIFICSFCRVEEIPNTTDKISNITNKSTNDP